MTYSDNNPERRNLIVLSLAIIVFYLGEGYLLKEEISFTLINIGFHNQDILVVLIWTLLGWFLFRYIVTNRNKHGEELERASPAINMDYPPVRKYIERVSKPAFFTKLHKTRIFCDLNGSWYMGFPNPNVPLHGFDGYLIRMLYLLKISYKHRATTDYYTPYFLFLFAVFLGINNFFDITSIILVLFFLLLLGVVEILYYFRK